MRGSNRSTGRMRRAGLAAFGHSAKCHRHSADRRIRWLEENDVAAVERLRGERELGVLAPPAVRLLEVEAPIDLASGESALVLFSGGQDSTVSVLPGRCSASRGSRPWASTTGSGMRSSLRCVPICARA